MDKNVTDKLIFLMVITILIVAAGVGIFILSHIHNTSYQLGIMSQKIENLEKYDLGVMAEKIGTLEELVPLKSVGDN